MLKTASKSTKRKKPKKKGENELDNRRMRRSLSRKKRRSITYLDV